MNSTQFRTLLWLRWRLTRNRLGRSGAVNKIIVVFITIVAVLSAIGAAVGGYFLGRNIPEMNSTAVLLIGHGIAAGLVFIWMIGFMVEIQRSEMIGIDRLLGLPVSLRQVFVLNYLASLVTPSLVVFVPLILGMSVGWTQKQPLHGAIFAALGLSLVLIVTAVVYMVRGWLAALMANKRRRRAIIVGLTFFFVLAGQLPNLIFNNPYMRQRLSKEREVQRQLADQGKAAGQQAYALSSQMLLIHKLAPPLWIGYGAMSLRENKPLPAVAVTLAILACGVLVLNRSYRSTLQIYLAAPKSKRPNGRATAQVAAAIPQPGGWIEKNLPGGSPEVSALTFGFARSMWQSPEIKMILMGPMVMILVVATMQMTRGSLFGGGGGSWKITGAVMFSVLSFVQLCYNAFGFERNGFRSLVLCPVRRSRILLAKNLACLPLAGGAGLILLIAAAVVFHTGLTAWLAGLFQLAAAFFLMSMVGNYCSILIPYRVNSGTLRPTRMEGKTAFGRFAFQVGSMCLMGALFIPALVEWIFQWVGLERVPVFLIASAMLAVALGLAYGLSLEPLGQMLHRREQRILEVVTHELE